MKAFHLLKYLALYWFGLWVLLALEDIHYYVTDGVLSPIGYVMWSLVVALFYIRFEPGKPLPKVSPSNITSLNKDEIFVFGSNLSGYHAGGAAKQAMKWGAEWGNPSGIQGATYAIPTKTENAAEPLMLHKVKSYVEVFTLYALDHPQFKFLVTEIGCGLAGFSVEDIAPMFRAASRLDNVYLPKRFVEFLNVK